MEAQPDADQLTMLPAAVLRRIAHHLDAESLVNLNRTNGLLSFAIYRATGPQSGLLTDTIPSSSAHSRPVQPDDSEKLSTIAPISLIRKTYSTSLTNFSCPSPTNAGGLAPQPPSASPLGPRRQNVNSNTVPAPQIGQTPSTSLLNPNHQSSTSEGSATHAALTPSTPPPSSIPKPTEVEIEWKALTHLPTSEESANEKTPSLTRARNRLPPLLSPTLPPSIEAVLAKLEKSSQRAATSENEAMEERKNPAAVDPPPSGEGDTETVGRVKSRGRSRRSRGRGSGRVRGESSTRGGGGEPPRGRRNRDRNYWRAILGPGMSRRTRSSESQEESSA
jgi:hypothetical protein